LSNVAFPPETFTIPAICSYATGRSVMNPDILDLLQVHVPRRDARASLCGLDIEHIGDEVEAGEHAVGGDHCDVDQNRRAFFASRERSRIRQRFGAK
jgi:hypothetical protein